MIVALPGFFSYFFWYWDNSGLKDINRTGAVVVVDCMIPVGLVLW